MADITCKEIGPGCPADGSPLGYAPNMAASIAFTGIFSMSLFGHTFLGCKYKTWSFMTAMLLGCSCEVVGYLGRILMHNNPYKLSTFLVQIVCLTTGPAFYSAGIYLCLARIVMVYGESISRVKPVWYTRFFVACDIVSLSLQGAGGGVASAATKPSTMALGNRLMLVGLILQIVSLLLFATMCAEFAFRVRKYAAERDLAYSELRTSSRFRRFLWGLAVAFITIFTRCVYRVIELGGGWNNKLMRDETTFIILESCMITVAVFALIIFHPGVGFQKKFNSFQHTPASRMDASKESVPLTAIDNSKMVNQSVHTV